MNLIRYFVVSQDAVRPAVKQFIETLPKGWNTDLDNEADISAVQLASLLQVLSLPAENLKSCEILFHIADTALATRRKSNPLEQKEIKHTIVLNPAGAQGQIFQAKDIHESAYLSREFYTKCCLENILKSNPVLLPVEKSAALAKIIREHSFKLTQEVEQLLEKEMGHFYSSDAIQVIIKPYLTRIEAFEKIAQGKLAEVTLAEWTLVKQIPIFYQPYKKVIDTQLAIEQARETYQTVIKASALKSAITNPLQFACHYGKLDQVTDLIAAKIDVNVRHESEAAALYFAAASREYKKEAVRVEIIKTLQANGADLTVSYSGCLPLYFVANVDTAKLLLQLGVEPSDLIWLVYGTADWKNVALEEKNRIRALIQLLVATYLDKNLSLGRVAYEVVQSGRPVEIVQIIILALLKQNNDDDKDVVLDAAFLKGYSDFAVRIEVLPLLYPPREYLKERLPRYLDAICQQFNNYHQREPELFLRVFKELIQHPLFAVSGAEGIVKKYEQVINLLAMQMIQQMKHAIPAPVSAVVADIDLRAAALGAPSVPPFASGLQQPTRTASQSPASASAAETVNQAATVVITDAPQARV